MKASTLFSLPITTLLLSTLLSSCGGGGSSSQAPPPTELPRLSSKASLGEELFSDINLSLNRSQSCASCHNPEHAFIDNRLDNSGYITAVSVGDDDVSLGDRNTPSLTYALLAPTFSEETHPRFNSQQGDYQGYVGGQFWDGRAPGLEEQASEPPLNPIEMGMPSKDAVVARIMENPDYIAGFTHIFGNSIFDSADNAYEAMLESLAEFERGEQFMRFDSKYDRSLTGDYFYDPLSKAALGKSLFFSQQFTNCATCHQLRPNGSSDELFTSFEFHNIGVPKNEQVRALNGKGNEFIDEGLLNQEGLEDASLRGKFKTPSLRNVAVTAPYMHNGVFRELKTVIEFYDHFLTNSSHTINPETGMPWRAPEVAENISEAELQDGNKLSDEEVEALVCFLRTLTDARYEALIPDDGIDCEI